MSMNNTTSTTTTSPNIYYSYVTVGALAAATNIIVLIIICTNRKLFSGHAFVVGLAVGDIFDGIALLSSGAVRLQKILNNVPFIMVHPFQCMLTYTPFFLLGNQIPGFMFGLIGLERYLAIGHFDWFYAKWTSKKTWYFASASYGICALSLLSAFIYISYQPAGTKVSSMCSTPTVMGLAYISYNYGVNILGGILAVVMTMVAMVILNKKKTKLVNTTKNDKNSANLLSFVTRQCRVTKSMMYVAVLDLGLVVVPNSLIVLNTIFGIDLKVSVGAPSLVAVSARSIFNILIYLMCDREFRKHTLKVAGLKKNALTILPMKSFASQSGRRRSVPYEE